MGIDGITRWLRAKGAVVSCTPEDFVIFLLVGFWGVLCVKPRKGSSIKTKNKQLIEKLNEWSFARVVWGGKSSNWPEVKAELTEWLK